MSWKSALENNSLKMAIVMSNTCNAKCPQCARTVRGTTKVQDWIKNDYITLEQISTYLPPENLKKFERIHYGGIQGDPYANPEIKEITEYLLNTKPDLKIIAHSNASLKTKKWWYEYGKFTAGRVVVTFAIDGTTQEMHEKYRYNTSLQKVLDNMKAFSEGGGTAHAFTVLFRHNYEYLDEIVDLAKEYGASEHDWVKSNRFVYHKEDSLEFIGDNGEKLLLENVMSDDPKYQSKHFQRQLSAPIDNKGNLLMEPDSIECLSDNNDYLYMTIDGILWPCSFIGRIGEMLLEYPRQAMEQNQDLHEIFDDMLDEKTGSLRYNSLKDLLENDLYKSQLFEMHKNLNTCEKICKKKCGVFEGKRIGLENLDV